ncbi:transposase, partial [bacterium]|nr:transposase [bacterium]
TNLKPVRWRVERTFAWFNYYRRLNRDHERTVSSSETMILVAMSQLMLRRLFRLPHSYKRWN